MISVCLATYNGEKYIKEQLDSILCQLSDEDEVVVSDDCSTDDTIKIIESVGDKRIKIFHHDKTTRKFPFDYATFNFENALKHSNGDYIFLADQDDVWHPCKVEKMMRELLENDVVHSDCYVTDEDLNVTSNSYYSSLRSFSKSIFYNFFKPSFLGSCMAFKKNVLKKVLPFPECGVGHDLWIGFVAIHHYKISFIQEPLMYYRRHNQTITDGGKKNNTSLTFKLKYRIYVLKSLFQLFFRKDSSNEI